MALGERATHNTRWRLQHAHVVGAEGELSRVIRPIVEGLANGAFKPVVAESFPFSDAAQAHRYLQEASNIGRVVLVPD